MVTGAYAALGTCTGTATQPIPTIAAPVIPLLTNLTLQAPVPTGPATLAVGNLLAGYLYSLQIADASAPNGFRDVLSVPPGSTSLTLPTPAAGCYRIFRNDNCGNSPAASPPICTLSLTGASTQNRNQLLLSDAGSPGTAYTVTRDGNPLTGFTTIAGGLEDPNVQCGTTYTYRVTATQPGGGTSVSNSVSIITQSAIPPAQPRLVASFNLNDVVELTPLLATATLPTGSTLRYSRTAAGGAPASFGTAASTRPRRDSTTLAELRAQPPCYSVRLVDVCGNSSPESPATCPALLSAGAADPAGTTATLTWTAFTGPDPGIPATYAIQRLAPDGTVLSTIPVSGSTFTDLTPPTDRQVLRYRLQIGGAGLPPGTFSYSNRATVTRQLFLTIPTAFTPNGDGLNDVLEVKGKYLENYTFVVVDRNGQEVFRGTQRSQTWDGTIRGRAPVLGAYVWRFQQDGEDGKRFTASGTVTILK
jgi:gliding motility-associated-like protein